MPTVGARVVVQSRRAVRTLAPRLARPRAGDVVAGITVALVVVPQALAYAQLAGMPPYRGLYAAALPPIAAALFASSPYLQTGPVALTSLLTFGALSSLATPGSGEYVGLGILLALVVGVVRLAVGLLQAGVLAYLVSQPMLVGFIPAAAIVIVASQLPPALGTSGGGSSILRGATSALAHPERWRLEALAVAAAAAALVLGGRLVHRLFPAVPLVVAAAVAYSHLAGYGGRTVGAIPITVADPTFALPWHELPRLLLPGAVIALVGFIEPSSIARAFAARERRAWNADREFVAQGAGNLTAFLVGAFPIGGSFSRSALNRLAGAQTTWSGTIAALAVLAFIPVAGSLSALPVAALAGIVIASVLAQATVLPLVRLGRLSRPQLVVALTTFAATLALAPHIERAVVVGIALAVALHLYRELQLEVEAWSDEETLHLRPHGVLWFATATKLEELFVRLVSDEPAARRLAVHLDALGRIDITGALALRSLLEQARGAGLEVDVVDVRPRWRGLVAHVIERRDDPLGTTRRDVR